MRAKRRIPCSVLAAALALACCAAQAQALSPWWHVTSGSRPAHILPGVARDEVYRLTVFGDEGEFKLDAKLHEHPEAPLQFPWNVTDQQLREGLEAVYGAGDVEVSGGPGGANGGTPYAITFVGALADQSVLLSRPGNNEPLGINGSQGYTELVQTVKGQPDAKIVVVASDLGDAVAEGASEPITIADQLPAGLKAVEARGLAGAGVGEFQRSEGVLACVQPAGPCTLGKPLAPYSNIEVTVSVVAEPGATSGGVNTASVSGGGAPAASAASTVAIGPLNPFGVEKYEQRSEEEGGALDTRAGSHPFQLTTTLTFNQTLGGYTPALVKDLHLELPPGLIGNPSPFARCTVAQFLGERCPASTIVGMAQVMVGIAEQEFGASSLGATPVYNLEPAVGEPARFAFGSAAHPVYLDASVRTGEDYGVTVSSRNVTQEVDFTRVEVTFWGAPGDSRHDLSRGSSLNEETPSPLLTMPTSCGGPLQSKLEASLWQQPLSFQPFALDEPMPAVQECERLPFGPTIQITPDTREASTPSGLAVEVHVPHELDLNPVGLAEADVRDTTVTLPEGMTLNPSGAGGLQACTEAQIGYLSDQSAPPEDLRFTPTLPEPLEPGVNFCPEESKVGTVEITSPLLPKDQPLNGAVYLAAQEANPFGSLVALYLVAHDPVSGTLVKLAGKVSLDQSTGRVSTTFANSPQLPFEDLKIHFFGGSRAPLSTPPLCSDYATLASFVSWSSDLPVGTTSSFPIASGPGGGPCVGSGEVRPFAPGFAAGSMNIQAAAFTPFTTTISRPDGSQPLSRLAMTLPPGLMASLSTVKLCPEPQATLGTCGADSLIGHTVVSAGLGPSPVTVKRPGDVYLTGPYEGAPFGLAIVNPTEAGPFDLGPVVVRAKIEVNPTTAQLTIASDPLPTILNGIPLQLQHVNVTVDRPGFVFNPTDCAALQIKGTMTGAEGTSAPVSMPFQVANCATLAFKPSFRVTTNGRTSRARGASLDVKLSYPRGAFGKDANIRSVKVSLPRQLPSRLSTLQKACPDRVFEQNPAACPPGSRVGSARAITPVVPVPLVGPAYFVSHGGAKFPELVVVLQGYGVTVQLHGETFISKKRITSSTFRSVPDVPVQSFELKLPQGPNSALAAGSSLSGGSLCKESLTMPTAFVAQNGLVIHQSTRIAITGCSRANARRRRVRHKRSKGST